jgi:hypothetical protein
MGTEENRINDPVKKRRGEIRTYRARPNIDTHVPASSVATVYRELTEREERCRFSSKNGLMGPNDEVRPTAVVAKKSVVKKQNPHPAEGRLGVVFFWIGTMEGKTYLAG